MIGAAEARCINCKTEVRPNDDNCRKCGDRVKPRPAGPFQVVMTEEDPRDLFPAIEAVRGDVTPANPVAPASAVQLTEEQAAAIERVRDWFTAWHPTVHNKPFRLFGPAGTGKTTLARHIGPALNAKRVVFGTFTGKAARVLRSKGVPATTIHSAIYALDFRTEKRARHRELASLIGEATYVNESGDGMAVDDKHIAAMQAELDQLAAELRRPAFTLNPMSDWAYADLIVLDEVSMVNEKIARDIESFGVPVLVLGDPAQLPPIEGGGHYTQATPDVLLETVHRQALESPVLALATHVRLGGSWADRLVKVSLAEAMAADQILVWKNATRWSLIRKIREKRGLPTASPRPGDRVMCLVNNKDLGVFNGQQFEVMDVEHEDGIWNLDLLDEDGRRGWYGATSDGFRGLEHEQAAKRQGFYRGEIGLFTWADAITVHKAQGSEWGSVYVVDQTHQMRKSTTAEKRAWAYTAISRASDKVTIASTEAE
jgi:exodeoxyribonuclease-5